MKNRENDSAEELPKNHEELFGVIATCHDCDWQATGSLIVDSKSNAMKSDILIKCRAHHFDQKPLQERQSNHNSFTLMHDRLASPGIAAIASAAEHVIVQLDGDDVPKTNEESLHNFLKAMSIDGEDEK